MERYTPEEFEAGKQVAHTSTDEHGVELEVGRFNGRAYLVIKETSDTKATRWLSDETAAAVVSALTP